MRASGGAFLVCVISKGSSGSASKSSSSLSSVGGSSGWLVLVMVTVRRPLEEEVEPREVEAMLTLLMSLSLPSRITIQFQRMLARRGPSISPFSDSNQPNAMANWQCCISLLFPIVGQCYAISIAGSDHLNSHSYISLSPIASILNIEFQDILPAKYIYCLICFLYIKIYNSKIFIYSNQILQSLSIASWGLIGVFYVFI